MLFFFPFLTGCGVDMMLKLSRLPWKKSHAEDDGQKQRRELGSLMIIYLPVCGSDGKESACNAGDLDSIPGLGRSPGEGNDNPLQYSCLENPMGR